MKNKMNDGLNILDFGAHGDGKIDNTAAIQKALDTAAEIRGTVIVPDGVFMCSHVHVPPHVGLIGNATWGYREGGGSILRLNDAQASCLIDITAAVGATINGLSLNGDQLGEGIHGIMMGRFNDKKEEDSPRIERCHISKFTGNGIHLDPVWCFSVRGCEVIFNRGSAMYVKGCDGFILDNWFSGNGDAGYCADEHTASVTMTANRIEWNHGGGIRIRGGSHYNITGNYIDRSGGPAISLLPRDDAPCFSMTVTGNIIYRSGKPEWTDSGHDSAHVRLEGCHGIVFSGNSMGVGQDDGGGTMSPQYGMVLRALKNSIVKDNALHIGAIKQLVVDLGEHGEGVVIKDNVGSLFVVREGESIWTSGQI